MNDLVVLAAGAFVTYTGARFRIGHVRDPFRLYEVSRDVVKFVAGFSAPSSPEDSIARLKLNERAAAMLRKLVDDMRADKILIAADEADDESAADVKITEFELTRTVNLVADIESGYPEFVEDWRQAQPHTLSPVPLGFALWDACRYVSAAKVPGAIVECGVWRGGSMMLAAAALRRFGADDRPLYLYDTYEWSWEEPADSDGYLGRAGSIGTASAESFDRTDSRAEAGDALRGGVSETDVRDRIRGAGYRDDLITTVAGYVQETIPATTPEQIAVLRLDTDFYESTMHEMEHLFPRLASGGVLLLDDYGKLAGATRAVDEYLQRHDVHLLLSRVDVQGRIAVKTG